MRDLIAPALFERGPQGCVSILGRRILTTQGMDPLRRKLARGLRGQVGLGLALSSRLQPNHLARVLSGDTGKHVWNRPRGDAHSPDLFARGLLSTSEKSYRPDRTASMADTSALACAATLSTGRFKSLAGKGAA